MNSEKIMKPLDELVRYIYHIPLIIEPFPRIPVNMILSEIRKINGKINSIFYRNNISTEIKLEYIDNIANNKNIKKIKFNGNLKMLKGLSFKKHYIIDIYLEEIIELSESTPIIIYTIDGLNEKHRGYLNSICKNCREYPRIKNAYSASISLKNIEELIELQGISGIQYNRNLLEGNTTKTFLPSTFW
jgi:hypothetical protein